MADPTQSSETATAPKRQCIIVLGMHRSGTSALTRVLSLLGASLPSVLMPAAKGNNETGFWEPKRIADLHDRMLGESGSRWDDWREFDFTVLPDDRRSHYRQNIRELIESEYGSSTLFVLKEPRISRFAALYIEALLELKIEPLFVHVHRNPLGVVASLLARDDFTTAFAGLVWLRHELSAEYATRGFSRVFVSYEGMIDGWRRQIDRIGDALGLKWPVSPDAVAEEIDNFISPTQRHHTATETELLEHQPTIGWIKETYGALKRLERDQTDIFVQRKLDAIRLEFNNGSDIFGSAAFPEFMGREQKTAKQIQSELRSARHEIDQTKLELDRSAAELRSARHEINQTKLELDRSKAEMQSARHEIDQTKLELDRSAAELRSARHEINQTKLELDRSKTQEVRAHNLLRLVRKQNEAMQSSTSWRLTSPMRNAKRLFSEKGFARQRAISGSRLIYNRLKLYRMRDWPIVGPLIQIAKNRLLGFRPITAVQSSAIRGVSRFSDTNLLQTAPRAKLVSKSGLRQCLDDNVGHSVGDPSEAALTTARQILAATDTPPKVSVVMPTWNRETTVAAALRSALNQSFSPFEIIVSDDGSTDATLDVIEAEFGDDLMEGRIKILRNAHTGVSAARNAALDIAKGDLIAYLDSDNTWRKDFLLLMSAIFAESDEVCTAYAALRQENADGGRVLVRGQDFDRALLLKGNYIDMNVFVHQRRLIKQFGGFRRDLTRLVDWDLIIRYTRNHEPVYLPFIGVDYNLGRNLNNITNTLPLAENFDKVMHANLPERLSLGLEGLRLAYFVYDYPALSQTFVLAEIKELLRRGADLKIYYVVSPDVDAVVDFEVEAHRVSNASDLANMFVEHRRNICHSHFAYPGVTNFVRPACQAAGVFYTFMPHAVDIFHEANRTRSQVGALGTDPLCMKVFVYGDFHRTFLESQGVPRAKIAYTFQAVDLAAFEAVRDDGIAAKPESSLLRIAAIGRFIEKKGFSDLIQAMSLLPTDTVQLDLYGYGPLEPEFRKLVTKLKLSNVNFMGAVKGVDALAAVYANADLLAVPCVEADNGDIDGFPTVILEAMVAGVPVLASTVSAIPDYIRHGVEGLLVPPKNPQAIADAITAHRRTSHSRKAAMISRARALVEKTIGVEKTVQRLLDTWLGYSIDIVLVTFNNEKHDNRAETFAIIDRIVESTTTNYTLTIIDNRSDDDFWMQLVDYVRGRSTIRLIRKKYNIFCGPASNAAIAHGTAEFIIYLCSKEAFVKEHGWERGLIALMRQQKEVGLAGHLVHLPKYTFGAELALHPAFSLFRNQDYAKSNLKRRFAHVQGGAKIIRREMFEAAGGYNDATPQDNMDVELSYYFESLGYRLAQLDEIASVTQKTRPGLEAILDEKTVVAHPLTLDTVKRRLDLLKDRNLHGCNLCGESFPAFLADDGQDAVACPHCGSLPLERLVFRVLSNAPYSHRGAKLAYLGKSRALVERLAGRMFKSVVAEANLDQFLNKIGKTDSIACIVVDSDFVGRHGDALWRKLAEVVEEHSEIIIAEGHSLTADDRVKETVSDEIAAILERRSLLARVSFSDIASERVGYDWRRLRRINIIQMDEIDLEMVPN
jgi:glycosyltransferase involved in cell wall biosynthesis